jgi:hypothetical protein
LAGNQTSRLSMVSLSTETFVNIWGHECLMSHFNFTPSISASFEMASKAEPTKKRVGQFFCNIDDCKTRKKTYLGKKLRLWNGIGVTLPAVIAPHDLDIICVPMDFCSKQHENVFSRDPTQGLSFFTCAFNALSRSCQPMSWYERWQLYVVQASLKDGT